MPKKRTRLLVLLLILLTVTTAWAKKMKTLKTGKYEAHNKANPVYFVATTHKELNNELQNRLIAMPDHKVKGRKTFRKGDKVKVLSSSMYTQQEKRLSALGKDGQFLYFGKPSKRIWRYGFAKVKVLTGQHKGKVGWMLYGKEKLANKDGTTPQRSYYTKYLRKPKNRRKKKAKKS